MKDKQDFFHRGVFNREYKTEFPDQENTQITQQLQESQNVIYAYFLEKVRKELPDLVLSKFRTVFLYPVADVNESVMRAIYTIIFANNETEFRNTLKRSCYILINNWDAARQYQPIRELIRLFAEVTIAWETTSLSLTRLRFWVANFVKSQDYEDLKLFSVKFEDKEKTQWSHRYSYYLLASQYTNRNNPIEQRKAAKERAKQLKDKFKFDLAMYTAHYGATNNAEMKFKNPTNLGNEILHLIKMSVARRGQFSYKNLANIFLDQTSNQNYRNFKRNLHKYLIISVTNPGLVKLINEKLLAKIELLFNDYNDKQINASILLRTCRKIIEYFTTEDSQNPSQLFILIVTQRHPIVLAILLLKVVLICPACRSYVDTCIAHLIRYYEKMPEEECQWVINIVEILNIIFAIQVENVSYNLVSMESNSPTSASEAQESYRVFSQTKMKDKPKY